MKELRYAGIEYDSVVDGDGIGATFFVQGCSHHCKGCHNPETWDKEGGLPFTREVFEKLMDYFDNNYIDHLTMSGGDPLDNLELTNYIITSFKYRYPDKKIWLYTVYIYENIKDKEEFKDILEKVDVLVDGPFIERLKDSNCLYRGSSNQRLIDLRETIKKGELILWRQ